MQLKMSEPQTPENTTGNTGENTSENTGGNISENVSIGLGGNTGGYPQEPMDRHSNFTSNNDFYTNQQDFDMDNIDMFGNPIVPESTMTAAGTAGGAASSYSYGSGSYSDSTSGSATATPYSGKYSNGYNPYNDHNGLSDKDNHIRKLTKREFFESPRNRKDRDQIIISAIAIIALAIFDIVRTNFWLTTLKKQIDMINNLAEELGVSQSGELIFDTSQIMRYQIISSVFFIALGIGIFLFKSRACAITGLSVTIISMIVTFAQYHKFRFYYVLLAFIYATIATININRSWKEYEENGDWKHEWKQNW